MEQATFRVTWPGFSSASATSSAYARYVKSSISVGVHLASQSSSINRRMPSRWMSQHACIRICEHANHEVSNPIPYLYLACSIDCRPQAPSPHTASSPPLPVSAILAPLYLADCLYIKHRSTLRDSAPLPIPRPREIVGIPQICQLPMC